MKQKLSNILLVLLLVVCPVVMLQSQVTIGSNLAPVEGALLDLKEKEALGNSIGNSSKGLGIPRVALTNLTQLFPMFALANGTTPTADYIANKAAIDKEHTGLIVYNVNLCITNPISAPTTLNKGIYVWDGTMWTEARANVPPKYQVFKDQDGNDFKAADFGAAGMWMIENLRAKKYADGTLLDPSNPNTAQSTTARYWAYPGPGVVPNPLPPGATGAIDGTDPYYLNQQPALGLLYNWLSTVRTIPTGNIEQGQGGANELVVGVQGICPDGWHVPSDREWNDLEREISTYPSKYGTLYSDGETPWNPSWETTVGDRPSGTYPSVKGHATTMKSPCPPTSSTTPTTSGYSKNIEQGGFSMILSGYGFNGKLLNFYGKHVRVWSSSITASGSVWNRHFTNTNSGVARYNNQSKETLSPVRCKKN